METLQQDTIELEDSAVEVAVEVNGQTIPLSIHDRIKQNIEARRIREEGYC